MNARTLLRVAGAALAAALGVVPLTVAAPAHAGQVNVTIGIQGSGFVRVVEGSLEDGGSETCDQSQNLDHRVVLTCARIRNEEPFEAWVWLRPSVFYSPPYWDFVEWQGCDQIRERSGVNECGVGSTAFGTSGKFPVAVFRDTKAPVVSNLQVAQTPLTQGGFRATWSHEGATRDECRIDGAPWATCTTPTDVVLAEGARTFEVRAEDASGNLSEVRRLEFRSVDTNLYGKPRDLVNSRTAQFWFSTQSGNDYDCSLDGVDVACTNEGTVRVDNLGEGTHVFTVGARYGDWYDPVPARWAWTVDTTAPDTTIDGGPAEGSRTRATSADFFLTTPGSAVSITCTLDGAPLTCRHGALALRDLPPGEHVLTAAGTDAAGNTDASPAVRRWTVDLAAPDTTITGTPAHGSIALSTKAAFTLGASEAGALLSCTVDGKARTCAAGPLSLSGLVPGTHELRAQASDAAGNTDPTAAVRTWTVPVPARSLVRSTGWRLAALPSAYDGRVLTTTRKNASASYSVRGARKLALVVGGGTTHGTVRVYAGSRLLTTVSLRTSRTVSKRVVPVTTFGAAWTGKVRVVVVTSGRTVRLEGIAAPTR
ncbi:MAG TPA: hypothetical protein VM575_11045 [Nocardioides sp.]|nr:hypothetical protein [Nocardioides sp.]